jgi:hypothetical protein
MSRVIAGCLAAVLGAWTAPVLGGPGPFGGAKSLTGIFLVNINEL